MRGSAASASPVVPAGPSVSSSSRQSSSPLFVDYGSVDPKAKLHSRSAQPRPCFCFWSVRASVRASAAAGCCLPDGTRVGDAPLLLPFLQPVMSPRMGAFAIAGRVNLSRSGSKDCFLRECILAMGKLKFEKDFRITSLWGER